jgi:APA family basic amino acid/polyamine antiporter
LAAAAAAVAAAVCRITVANLILEYILANAAAIRGFSPYFAMLVNKPSDFFIMPYTSAFGTTYNLDW